MVFVVRRLIKVSTPKGILYFVDYSKHFGIFKWPYDAALEIQSLGFSPRNDLNSYEYVISPELEDYLGENLED